MSFFSLRFIALLAITVFLVFLISKLDSKWRGKPFVKKLTDWTLIISSIVFIGSVDVRALLLVFLLAVVEFVIVSEPVRKLLNGKMKFIGIICALGLLLVFKYFDFFIDSICSCFGINDNRTLILYVPLGISYFSFSVISYVCDIYDKKTTDKVSFSETLLYIMFFPKFISGPIVKASDFFEQVNKDRPFLLSNLQKGVQIFLFGMFKKAVIADNLSPFVDSVFETPAAFDSLTVWMAVISYTLQLYFDFSGYSDMAIGCAAMLGFDFKRNFDTPFAADSIQNFWRRWHISLSTWFRDYVYIPLGGNRKGKSRTGLNKTIVFLLTGFWHGANWTFVVWGLLHGLFLLLETYKIINTERWKFKPLKYIYTTSVVVFAFMIFRAESLVHAFEIFKGMFAFRDGVFFPSIWFFVAISALILSLYMVWKKSGMPKNSSGMHASYICLDLGKFRNLMILWALIFAVIIFANMGSTGFIYAQF